MHSPSALACSLDDQLAVRARQKRIEDHAIVLLLAEIERHRVHQAFGYAKVADYAAERHGLTGAKERALLGKRLATLPRLDRCLAEGRLDWTKARHVASIATPETVDRWIEIAFAVPNRVLEPLVRESRVTGVVPEQAQVSRVVGLERVTLRLTEEEADTFHAALAVMRARAGVTAADIDDGALVVMVLQRFLAEVDPNSAPNPDRSRFLVAGHSSEVEVDAAPEAVVRDEAACDGDILTLTGPKRGRVSRAIPLSIRRAVLARDQHRCQVPGCTNRWWLDLHHVTHRAHGGDHDEANIVAACSIHHRMSHTGRLMIEAENGGFRFRFPDGRDAFVPHPSPRKSSGRAGRRSAPPDTRNMPAGA